MLEITSQPNIATSNISEFKVKIEKLKIQLRSLEKQTDIDLLIHLVGYSNTTSTSHGLNFSNKPFENSWDVDSGATKHITNTSKHFHTHTRYNLIFIGSPY